MTDDNENICSRGLRDKMFTNAKLFIFIVTEATQEKAVRAPVGVTKQPRKFAGVVIVTTGLPARGKSQVAHSLARRLNWNGVNTKGILKYELKSAVNIFKIFYIFRSFYCGKQITAIVLRKIHI